MRLPSLILMLLIMAGYTGYAHASTFWEGLWFECEFAGRTAPPADGCAMLDDDGFIFSAGQVTHVKVRDSVETDACKKQRAGQCFRADAPSISISVDRKGKAEFTDTTLGIRFLGCTQIFHKTDINSDRNTDGATFVEARPDGKRCYWAGEKHFYLRRYLGEVKTIE